MSILVVKFGTKELCNESGRLDQMIFDDFARQLVEVQKQGIKPVIVSSGAIQAGKEELEMLQITATETELDKKEIAGIGASRLLSMWQEAFCEHNKVIAQVWVTYANWQNRGERESIKNSIRDYLQCGVIPIINENDVVSDKEIKLMERRISENDRLTRMIAQLINADAVLFLTDVGGVYEEDPKVNPQAQLYEEIDARTLTAGLQFTKAIEAAQCYLAGRRVTIAGQKEDVIIKFVRGESVGTRMGRTNKFKP